MPISAAAAAALNVTSVSTPVTVSDAAANVLSNLTALQALAAAAKLASITLTDSATPSLALTAAQVVTGAQALLKITTSYTINVSGTVTVAAATALNATLATKLSPALALTDSLAAVGSNLAALQTLAAAGRIASITLTDSGTPNLTLTGPNLVIYAATLMKIGGSFTLTLSGSASAAQANAANPALVAKLTSGFAVSDTAANVATYIAGLQTRFAAGKLASIALTDGGTPALTLTIAQVAADIGALGKITGNYTINASGTATAAQAAALTSAVAAKLSAGLAVSDTAANVMASIAGLQVVAAAGKLASVTLTNGGTPSLSMTAAQLIADAQALLKIAGSYTIAVTGVASATQAAGVNATLRGKLSASLSVTDTAANVTANLGGLQSMVAAAKLASIALSDSGTPVLTLTGAQLGAASAVLLKITGSFALHISGALTAAQAAAMGSILAAKLNAAVTVSDTMANIGSNLSALQTVAAAGRLASITLTDGSTPTLTLSAPALVQNAAALVRIASPFAITLSGTASAAQVSAANPNLVAKLTSGFVVTDTAANVTNYLTQLQARAAAGKLVSVTLTDAGTPTISVTSANLIAASAALAAIGGTWNLSVSSGTVTVAQALTLPNGLAAHLTGGLGVSDSAANVAGGLDGLQTLAAAGRLTGIALSDGGTPTLTVPVTTLLTDAQALGLVGGSWHLAISSASLTCAQTLAIGGTLAGHLTGPVAVTDSSAAVAANLAGLQAMSSAISGVTLTETPVSFAVTADQLWHDAAILNLIIAGGVSLSGSGSGASAAASSHLASAPSYTGTLSFTDTAANVAAYLDNLQSLASAGHLGTITLSNGGTPALSITAARLLSDTGALAAIGGAYTISIASGSVTVAQALAIGNTLLAKLNATLPVRDTSTNVLNNLDALQNRAAALGSVSFSSGATTLSMTGTRAVSVIGVLSVLSGVTVTISGTVTAAQAAAISGSNLPAHLLTGPVVSDTAANIVSALGGLASLAAVNKLGSITVSDAGTLTLTAQQLSDDVPVLRKITSAATIAVSTPLTAAQAAGISSVLIARLSSSLAVSDSAANVLANLDALQALASGGHLGSVALNDGGTPVLSVTGDQMYSDADVLAVISGTYQLEILGGITADQAASFAATTGRLATGVYVVDSAANVQADIASLETLAAAGKLASITFTDAGTPTLTLSGAAFSTGSDALLTIVGGFAITLSSPLTVAQLQAADGNGLLPYVDAAVAVTDTAAHIAGAIDALHGLGSTVGAITLTDVSPSLALSSQQFVTDSDVLLKIGGVYAIGLSGSLTVAQAEAAAGNGLLALVTGGAVITDTATNVQAALDALLPLHADLSGIILTDGGTPTVSVSAARLVTDAAILSLIGGTWRLAVSSGTVTVAQAQALPSPVTAHLTAGLTVTGSAAAVTAALDGLQSLGIVIVSVSLTDGGTPSLSLSASQLIADAPLLLKIGGSFGLAVTGSATAQQAVTIDSNLRVRISGGLQVADSAASVTAYLGGLQTLAAASVLAGITLTDAGIPNVTVDAATLVADQAALAAIAGSYALTVATGSLSAAQAANLYSQVAAKLATGLTVQDSAANVVSHLAGLQAGQSHIAAVSLTDDTPVLSLTANQLVADAAILQKISGGFAITLSGTLTVAQAETAAAEGLLARVSGGAAILDTASDVQAALDQLETLSPHLGFISLSDAGTPAISVDTTTLFNDTNALALIGDPWALVVSAGSASVAQVTSLSGTVSSHLASGLMVADGAATVAANINALQTVLDTIQAITLTDGGTPALPLTAQQLADDAAVLQKINGTWSITLSGSLNVQQAETAQSQGLLSLVTGGAAIAETAANVAAGLDALQGLGSAIASITLTDDGTPSILVDEGTILADSATLAKIGGTWNLSPSSGALTAVQALSLSPSVTSHLSGSLAVADSAANIVTSLDALQAAGSLIGPVTLTDGATPSLALNLSQFTHDADALGKITSPYTISLSSPLTVDQAVTAQEQGLLGKVAGGAAIADTAAHVRGGIDGLQNLGGAVASITLTNGGTPALSLTAQQLIGDADALVKIGGGWTISLSGSLTAAQAALANAQSLLGRITNGVAVADSGASVQAALSTLAGFTGAIASISLTDITPPVLSLTAAAVAADHAVLALIDGDWQLTVSSGTNTVAEALAIGPVVGSHLTIGLDIHDSASNVLNSLASLTAVQSMIGAITLADATPPDLAMNAATFTTGAVILQKIGSPFTIGLSGTLTAQQAVSANGQGLLVTVDGGAQISDTIAGLVAHLDAVQSLGSHIAAVSLNGDDGTALVLTAATVLADAGALAKITGTWTLSIAAGTFTAAQAVNLDNMITSHLATALNIVDGSADIAAQIDALQAMGGNIATITLTDDAPELALTTAQFVNDPDTLLKIDGTYAITLSGTLTVDQAATAFSRGLLNKIPAGAQISDSAANIQTGLDGLQAEAGTLAGISLNNGGTPVISVTAARLMADADALALIGGSWNLAITSGTLTAAQALVLPQSVVSRIPGELSVTSGQNSLDGLQGIVSALATVAFDASNTQLSLTSARFVDDTPTLLKVTSTYTIVLTGTLTAAQAINANTNGLLTLVTGGAGVSDTAANINAALDPLEGFADRIAAITLTDEATPTITITAATLVADADALALISGNYHLAVSSGSVTAAQALALPSRVTQHLTDGLSVADSLVNVTADLTLLEAMVEAGSVASIILTDSGQPSIALSSTTIMTDVRALGAIAMHSDAGSFALSASSGTFTAAQVTSLLGHGLESDLSGTFAVTDSASHMVANLPALQTLAAGGHLGAVTLTTAPAALSVTAAQAGADATAINDVMGGSGANPHAVLYVNGTTGGDTVNVSALTHATNINLIGDSASMFANGGIAFIDGSADSVALGSAASTIHYTAGQGVEVVDGFQIGTHLLDWALSGGADASEIGASDVTYNGNAAVAITQGSDTTHGVILVNPGVSAEVIVNDHLFTAGTHALIT